MFGALFGVAITVAIFFFLRKNNVSNEKDLENMLGKLSNEALAKN